MCHSSCKVPAASAVYSKQTSEKIYVYVPENFGPGKVYQPVEFRISKYQNIRLMVNRQLSSKSKQMLLNKTLQTIATAYSVVLFTLQSQALSGPQKWFCDSICRLLSVQLSSPLPVLHDFIDTLFISLDLQ